jgi:Transposase IS200 like
MKALAVGGVADHVHMLISLPATLSVAQALQLLKGNSSKWIHETFPELHSFEWHGREDMAHSGSPFPVSTAPSRIFGIRPSIIAPDRFDKNS